MSSVSVFVPAYNYAHFLRDCVGSVLTQEGVTVQVLVIDDASSDNTPAVAEQLMADDRVEYVRHRVNCGHIATYNEGIAWASSDYVVLLSADDMLTPGALRRATTLLDAHPEAAFAYGGTVRFRSGSPLPPARSEVHGGRTWVWEGHRWIESVCRAGRNFIAAPEVVVRTSVQHRVGGYRPELPRTGDLEMWLRLAAHGDVGYLEDSDQAYYRLHEQNMHITRLTSAHDVFGQRMEAWDAFFRDNSASLPEGERLQALARTSLARTMLTAAIRALDAGRPDVDGTSPNDLVALASQLTDVRHLREHRALQWRLRAGPQACRWLRPFVEVGTMRHPRAWLKFHLGPQRPVV